MNTFTKLPATWITYGDFTQGELSQYMDLLNLRPSPTQPQAQVHYGGALEQQAVVHDLPGMANPTTLLYIDFTEVAVTYPDFRGRPLTVQDVLWCLDQLNTREYEQICLGLATRLCAPDQASFDLSASGAVLELLSDVYDVLEEREWEIKSIARPRAHIALHETEAPTTADELKVFSEASPVLLHMVNNVFILECIQ